MAMSPHKKFANELRTPVREFEQIRNEPYQRKKSTHHASSPSRDEKNDLMNELEALFDELFGSLDESTSN